MPVMTCMKDGVAGYKWGEGGVCFPGPQGKDKAIAVGRAIEAQKNENSCETENAWDRLGALIGAGRPKPKKKRGI